MTSKTVVLMACALLLLNALAASDADAQENSSDRGRVYVGLNIGRFFEAWEGNSGSATIWKVVVGYDFKGRWGVRGEFGGDVEICDRDATPVVAGVSQQGSCHLHFAAPSSVLGLIPYLLVSTSAVYRFPESRAYMAFGFPHIGMGVESPIGNHFAISPEVELSYTVSAASIWAKAAATIHSR